MKYAYDYRTRQNAIIASDAEIDSIVGLRRKLQQLIDNHENIPVRDGTPVHPVSRAHDQLPSDSPQASELGDVD